MQLRQPGIEPAARRRPGVRRTTKQQTKTTNENNKLSVKRFLVLARGSRLALVVSKPPWLVLPNLLCLVHEDTPYSPRPGEHRGEHNITGSMDGQKPPRHRKPETQG